MNETGVSEPGVLVTARRIGEQVLLPNALRTDAADVVDQSQLDLLAGAGFYGIAGPIDAGGLGADVRTMCDVVEVLAGCCLTTTFVWIQHHGAVFAVAGAPAPVREQWLAPLCRGERRAGLAIAGIRPGMRSGHRRLTARPVPGGWVLEGTASWVTGWGRIDVVHTAALHTDALHTAAPHGATQQGDGSVIWMLVDATECETLRVERVALLAVNASATVLVHFLGHFVPSERVLATLPYDDWAARDAAGLRVNGSLALGVAGRCCTMLGPTALDDEVASARAALDQASAELMPEARAAASLLAVRAASALVAASGSGAVLMDGHPQRLAREALFLLAFGQRPAIRSGLLARLGAEPRAR